MDKLYQDDLKSHYQEPVGLNRKISTSHSAEGFNASCGDEINIHLQIDERHAKLAKIAFDTDSCAICTASASILCQLLEGKGLESLQNYYHYLQLKLNKNAYDIPNNDYPSELDILTPVKAHPSRINCALLPWQTALSAFASPVNTSGNLLENKAGV